MKPAITVRHEIENYLRRTGTTLYKFAEISGINPGTVSSILSGQRHISILNLDRMTAGMGLEEGSFYDLYLEGCLLSASPNWRRLGPFLRRCAELDKLDCIERLVKAVADHLTYVPLLFETAEVFFREEKKAAAALLYDCVAECEKYQHSERLALCRYRLFTIGLGADQEENKRAAALFENYADRLDEAEQLDALKDLADVYASLHQWDRVDYLADKLGQKATVQYLYRPKRKRKVEAGRGPSRPHIFYLLYAYLLRANVCDARQEYNRALEYVRMYSNCGQQKFKFGETSEQEGQILEQFREWGKANAYLYRLMSGQVEVLADYVHCIAAKEHEIVPAMYRILQAANQYHLNVDHLLERFKGHFEYKERSCRFGKYNAQIAADQYVRFLSELAFYYLHTQRYDLGIRNLLKNLEICMMFHHESVIIRCVGLFEKFRHKASGESQERYKNLICEVHKE